LSRSGPILAEPLLPSRRMAARRHSYTIEQANALIPQVRAVLLQLAMEQRRMDAAHAEMHRYLASNGDPGTSAEADRLEREAAGIGEGMRTLVGLLDELGVQLRDPEMGLVDFPARRWRGAGIEMGGCHVPHRVDRETSRKRNRIDLIR